MKFLIYILFLAASSCYAGDTIGDTYFADNGHKCRVLTDSQGRYYVDGGQKCRIDGISGSETTYWDGVGYFDSIQGTYVTAPSNGVVIVNVIVYSNGYNNDCGGYGYRGCLGGVGYISNGGFPYFNNSGCGQQVFYAGKAGGGHRGGGNINGGHGGRPTIAGGPRFAPPGRPARFTPPSRGGGGIGRNSGGRGNFSVAGGRSSGYSRGR